MKYNIYIIFFLCLMTGNVPVIGQYGFNKYFYFERSSGLDFDDILLDTDGVVVRGNIFNDTMGLWGLFLCRLDTLGQIIWHRTIMDSLGASDIISNIPTKFIQLATGGYLIPVNYFGRGTFGLYKLGRNGFIEFSVEFENNEKAIIPNHLVETETGYYISGYQQRSNSGIDVFILKTDLLGNKIWLKYFGTDTLNEYSAGLVLNDNHSISIGCQVRPPNFQDLPFELQWRQPLLITIDTNGQILKEWKGQPNDAKAKAMFGLQINQKHEWGVIYSEYEKVFTGNQYEIFGAPSVSVLDSSLNLKWKNTFGPFTSTANTYFDLTYDSLRREWITVGQLADHSRLVGCIVKYDEDGSIIWSVLDTAFYNPLVLANHYLGGVVISPYGSIYTAGKIDYSSPPYYEYGWILKITADGCVDTLCTTTSIEEIIQSNQQKLYLYPNPVEDQLNIRLDESLPPEITISIVNAMGQRMYTGTLEDHKMSISVSDWPAGLCFVQAIHHGKHIASVKVIHL